MATRRLPWYRKVAYRTVVTATLSSGMAGAAGVVSYVNVRSALLMGHQHELVADCLAAVPDITMGLSLLKLSERRGRNEKVTPWAWVGYGLGLATSLAGNEVAEFANGWIGRVSGLLLPLFVTVCVEIVRHAGRPSRSRPARSRTAPRTAGAPAPARQRGRARAEVATA